ncbi:DUF305 domain-containing protein [Ciceribacter selenitireducens]|jgi:peptidoglycan/LPS O-acetylase OafA/YrhL
MSPYLRFAVMIAVSTAIMFALMYLNVFAADHIFFSQTRLFMALIMGSVMAVVMLAFMRRMYPSRIANAAIVVLSLLTFAGSLYLVRSQTTVGQIAWMKAMIPHHSIAILTSERATLTDPRVRDLAAGIIETQREEITRMKQLIAELEKGPGSR